MAKSTGATVIAPDYRRAPQNQFPGPFDDCLAGKNPKFREVDTGPFLCMDYTNISFFLVES